MSATNVLAVFDALTSIARSRRRMLNKKAGRSSEPHPEAECAIDRIDYVLEQAAIARANLVSPGSADAGLDELVRRGIAAWSDVPDTWLEALRGGSEG
jgi:hypothetical protein